MLRYPGRGLAGADAALCVYVPDMSSDGGVGQCQLGRDLPGAVPLGQEAQDVPFPGRQPVEKPRRQRAGTASGFRHVQHPGNKSFGTAPEGQHRGRAQVPGPLGSGGIGRPVEQHHRHPGKPRLERPHERPDPAGHIRVGQDDRRARSGNRRGQICQIVDFEDDPHPGIPPQRRKQRRAGKRVRQDKTDTDRRHRDDAPPPIAPVGTAGVP